MQYFLYLLNIELILLWMMTTNWFLMYVYRLIIWYRKLRKAVTTICEGVDEMRCINANTALNLFRGGL
jgi:hypothetical protein